MALPGFLRRLFGGDELTVNPPEFSVMHFDDDAMSAQSELEAYKTLSREVIDYCGESAPRSWDDRFDAAVVQFNTKQGPALEEALVTAFTSPAWVPDTLADAPPAIAEIADTFGGLDEEQKLFVAGVDAPVQLIAAWWPWRDGENISLRFMLRSESMDVDARSEALRQWFSL